MQILNLANVDKSDIKWSVSRFPDGEIQITLEEFSRKDNVEVRCRITNAEELFLVKQVFDILDRSEVVYDVFISYLMGMRMDRVMDFNRPFTLKIVADILKSSKARSFDVLEPHSGRTIDFLGIAHEPVIERLIPNELQDYQLVFPDAGAKERYGSLFYWGFDADTIFCSKVRDIKTGKILSIQVDNPEKLSNRPMLIVDDLCDGGGTFVGVAEVIRAIKPDAKLNIKVIHMVNPRGIENLSKNFDHVWFTNSYKDWSGYKVEYGKVVPMLPKNVTQIEVI